MKNRRNKDITTRPIAICLFAALLLAGTAVGEVSREGLVAEWHFNGDAKDSSGNGNDGTIYGATFINGKFGKTLSFSGVDNYVTIPDSSGLNPVQITVEAWIKAKSKSDYQLVVDKSHGWTDGTGWELQIYPNGFIDFGYCNGNTFCGGTGFYATSTSIVTDDVWHHVAGTLDGTNVKIYVDGVMQSSVLYIGSPQTNNREVHIGMSWGGGSKARFFNGIIDEVRIYNRALTASEIKELYEGEQTALSITKSATPYSLRQFQESTIKVLIENTGTSEVKAIEIMDSIHPSFDLTGGDFPNPKKFDSIRAGETRELQYTIKSKESGAFTLDPATVTYADSGGNIQEVKSEPVSIKVVPSSNVGISGTNKEQNGSVHLTGEKTDVVMGEDVLLKLSAVNLITKPQMHVQVIIKVPSGMSVTSSEFSKSGTNQFTANYSLESGDGKDVEVRIRPNQIGDFIVYGRVVYYFGDNKGTSEDYTLDLPIKVMKDNSSVREPVKKPTTGFEGVLGMSGLLFVLVLIKSGLIRKRK